MNNSIVSNPSEQKEPLNQSGLKAKPNVLGESNAVDIGNQSCINTSDFSCPFYDENLEKLKDDEEEKEKYFDLKFLPQYNELEKKLHNNNV